MAAAPKSCAPYAWRLVEFRYCERKTYIGSVRDALRAGKYPASRLIPINVIATIAKSHGSAARTSKSWLCTPGRTRSIALKL
ncbi:MAG TPA: hypothetical protein VIC32_04375 [Terriglobales bacterium]|jgi:hypothetical protein